MTTRPQPPRPQPPRPNQPVAIADVVPQVVADIATRLDLSPERERTVLFFARFVRARARGRNDHTDALRHKLAKGGFRVSFRPYDHGRRAR